MYQNWPLDVYKTLEIMKNSYEIDIRRMLGI